jgi:Cu2+-exporting ATPase
MQAMMYASALWFGAFDDAGAATRDLFPVADAAGGDPVVFYSAGPFFAGRAAASRRDGLGMDVPVALAVALIYAGASSRS